MHTKILTFFGKHGFALLLFLLVALFFVLAVLSPLSYGGADDIVHYRFAHYSFQHPGLLLDHWAKPFFTLLASPFAQLGYWGVKLFNLLVGAFTGFILYRLTALLHMRRNKLILVILFFIPVYTTMLMSGMTEILFASVLTLAAFLFLRKEFVWSAVAISFLPLVRTEGIVIWPWFVVAFLYRRKWVAIPFILSATIIYSIIGGLYFNDFLWLYTHLPYSGTGDIYGHGDLLHFVRANKSVFGNPITLFFLLGVVATIFRKRKPLNQEGNSEAVWDEIFVILAPLLTYYAAHSYVWWKGISSYGLVRVMAGVAPLFAFYGLKGLNFLVDNISLHILRTFVVAVFLVLVVITPFNVYEIPMKLSEKDKTVKRAAEWFSTSSYKNRKFYVWDNYFYFVLGTDPYDSKKMGDGIPDRKNPENWVQPGEIVIWDAHFSAVDGRFPLNSITNNPYYKLIKVIRPRKSFESGGGTYQLCFFERQDLAYGYDNRKLLDSLADNGKPVGAQFLKKQNFSNESNPDGIKINAGDEYCVLLEMDIDKTTWEEGDELGIKLIGKGKPMLLVISVGNDKKAGFYQSFPIHKTGTDTIGEYNIQLPEITKRMQKLKVYLWNKEKVEATVRLVEVKIIK